MKDKIYQKKMPRLSSFVFDKKVSAVFEDMAERSIPFYSNSIEAIGFILKRFPLPDGKIYDLGTSTGKTVIHLCETLPERKKDLIGIDNSEAMITKAKETASRYKSSKEAVFLTRDITQFPYEPAAAAILNFTLQFVTPEKRNNLLRKLYDALLPGGMIIITDKISFSNVFIGEKFTDIYYDFKRKHGYSELEISQKREALENVLIPDTIENNLRRLEEAGFSNVTRFFQWFNFAGFLGIKND